MQFQVTFRAQCVLMLLLILAVQTSSATSYPDPRTYSLIKRLETALQAYRDDTGSYPSTDQGLRALAQKPERASGWRGPYIAGHGSEIDGWGEDLIYSYPPVFGDKDFDLYSKGANQRDDRGEADDITNWAGVPQTYDQRRKLEVAGDTLLFLIFPWVLFW